MANYSNLSSLFTAIADAIRSKTGETDTIVADDFPTAIEGIESGGMTITSGTCSGSDSAMTVSALQNKSNFVLIASGSTFSSMNSAGHGYVLAIVCIGGVITATGYYGVCESWYDEESGQYVYQTIFAESCNISSDITFAASTGKFTCSNSRFEFTSYAYTIFDES